jgi:hypothetical protein
VLKAHKVLQNKTITPSAAKKTFQRRFKKPQEKWKRTKSNCANVNFSLCFAKTLKPNYSGNQSKKRVVRTLADVKSRMNFSPSLPDQNTAGIHALTIGSFYTKAFGLRISSVSRGAHALLMCHNTTSLIQRHKTYQIFYIPKNSEISNLLLIFFK